jgi:hypothetical protein
MNTTNEMNNINTNYIEEYVSELVNNAKKEYDLAINWTKNIHKVKEVFTLAAYKVETLLAAPVASTIEDMPIDFNSNYLEAISKANIAVSALKKNTEDVVTTYFNIDKTTSTELSVDAEGIDTSIASSYKKVKYDKSEVVKNKLKVVCDSYEKARLILVREMQKYTKLMEAIMADAVPDEDEVLFNVRGELVTASRVSLINTTTTNRTYFDGMLNTSGGWKSDVIGMCTITL